MLKRLPLQTPRLRLRPATARDVSSLQQHWPAALAHAGPLREAEQQDAGLWLIALADSAQDIGCVGLRPSAMAPLLCDEPAEPFEPLVLLHPPHRGRGYAQEALKCLLWHAQSGTRGRCFVAVCDVPNTSADRLLRRLGFQAHYECEGEHRRLRQYRMSGMRTP